VWKDFVHQQGGTFCHTPCPAAGTETAAFTTKGYQAFRVAGFTTHSQETVFKTAAFEVVLELALHVSR
jgi:hypothetical protein